MTAIAVQRPGAPAAWTALLGGAALAQATGLAAAAVLLGDAEAAAIGVATLLALGLRRFRGGMVGSVLLGLLFADVAFFMGAAAFTNLIARADPAATIGSGVLSAIAIAGLAAVVPASRRSVGSTRSAAIVAVAVAAAFATLTATSIFTGGVATAVPPEVLRLETKGLKFSRADLTASAGSITVLVANRDLFWHTFTIDALGVDLRVPVGGEHQVSFTARPGTYAYYCAIPGHEMLMKGTLTVR